MRRETERLKKLWGFLLLVTSFVWPGCVTGQEIRRSGEVHLLPLRSALR